MHDGAVSWSDEDGSVVVYVDDGDLEKRRAPERRPTVIRRHYGQIKPLKTVQQTQRTDQTGVGIERERIWEREREKCSLLG